jgi:magnesium-protoporphyrin O-methyltransferase
VPSCCDPNGLGNRFGAKGAEADARAYLRRGLDRDERRVVAFLEERGVAGATVLEVGGGVGAMQVDLLRAGATHAYNVEISPHYETSAREIAVQSGVADRVQRVVADFVAVAAAVPPADAVIMHKVVCCYPDMPGLVRPAAERTRRWLVLTFPADRWWIRAGLRAANAVQTLVGSRYRVFFHEPLEIQAVAERTGLHRVADQRGIFWQFLALERA